MNKRHDKFTSWCCRFCRKEARAKEVSTCLCLIFERSKGYEREWIIWSEDKKIVLSFSDFQMKFKPSDKNFSNFEWICVWSSSKVSSPPSPDTIEECLSHLSTIDQTATSDILAIMKETAKHKILQTAINSGRKSGKWIIFVKKEQIDLVWAKISSAQFEGLLGCGCKVNPPDENANLHLICVYVQDFSDVDDRLRVKNALIELNITGLKFRPCIFTELKMHFKNEWMVNVTLTDDYEESHDYKENHSLEPPLKRTKY